ncbi:GH36-type glycosyl hydrolase domain-containing protein [Acidobacteriota bacterium]
MNNRVKVYSLLVLIGILFSTGVLVSCKSQKKKGIQTLEYGASIRAESNKYSIKIGSKLQIDFQLKNTGQQTWSSLAENPCLLSYHLLDENGGMIRNDNRRFSLPKDILPGQKINFSIDIRSPLEKGRYILEFDLLREGLFWFNDRGSKTRKIDLNVLDHSWSEDEKEWTLDYGAFTKFNSNIEELNSLFRLIRLTLDQSEVEFPGQTGNIFGFSAGTEYPQIWVRDANTILFASKFFYEQHFLTSWIEEHLAFQKDNGSLEDWINVNGESEKNTTETDQETSIVQSAHQVFEILGPEWLHKTIQGKEIISRLDKALMFVLQNRFNKNLGLITGAHTADWGDVDIVDTGDLSVDVDANTIWTADIYDQGMFYLAASQLADMYERLGKESRFKFWEEAAESIKTNANTWLWQEDKGFYKVHVHLDSIQHDFDESNIFAMGGNVTAVLAGIADQEKRTKIIMEALDRQKAYDVSTISGTLLPPYPENVFKHPLLDSPFEYQNGAQWDWFGGRLIHTMFFSGFSQQATKKLFEIIDKNIANRGFFEWDDQKGTGRGSDFFCGSAGSLGLALFEGYLGIKLTKNSLLLEPRISQDNCRVHAYLPASDSFVAYEYTFFPDEDKIEMAFNSNMDTDGQVKILSPWILEMHQSSEELSAVLSVRKDNQIVPFSVSRINLDTYIVINTDFKSHILEIQKKSKRTEDSE